MHYVCINVNNLIIIFVVEFSWKQWTWINKHTFSIIYVDTIYFLFIREKYIEQSVDNTYYFYLWNVDLNSFTKLLEISLYQKRHLTLNLKFFLLKEIHLEDEQFCLPYNPRLACFLEILAHSLAKEAFWDGATRRN